MKYLLNTLFVTSEDIYLSLDGENVVANRDKREVARYPLHTLSGIISFSYPGASPALMGACAPVSYTHLDVYKRQPRSCSAPPPSPVWRRRTTP